jgi:hypothetical protein
MPRLSTIPERESGYTQGGMQAQNRKAIRWMAFPRDNQSLASLKLPLILKRTENRWIRTFCHPGRGRISKDVLSSAGILFAPALFRGPWASLAVIISAIGGPFSRSN